MSSKKEVLEELIIEDNPNVIAYVIAILSVHEELEKGKYEREKSE